MQVKYIYSACLEIDVQGFKILTDPWFTDGAYDGSWFQFPKVNPFDHISKPDLVYISHIHPDHYDPIFLHQLREMFGDFPILIPSSEQNYLQRKGTSDGLKLTPTRFYENSMLELYIEENNAGSASDIDSAMLVREKSTNRSMLNLNDCLYNPDHIKIFKQIIKKNNLELDLLALGYAAAGPFPQTYFDLKDECDAAMAVATAKKHALFERYKRISNEFSAKFNLPFAGEYMLGGHLAVLNPYRGAADAVEVKDFDDKAVVLRPGGSIDLEAGVVKDERTERYLPADIERRCAEISAKQMDYEIDINLPLEKINFSRLLRAAIPKAQKKSEVGVPYTFVFSICKDGEVCERYAVNLLSGDMSQLSTNQVLGESMCSELIIDYRYFFGLLTGVYHWDNAETGSQFLTRRFPRENFQREVQSWLNFLAVC